jgi:hypothetical protein
LFVFEFLCKRLLHSEQDLEQEDVPLPGLQRLTSREDIGQLIQQVKEDEHRQKGDRSVREHILKNERGFSEEHAEGVS